MKPLQMLPEVKKDRTWRRNTLKYWSESKLTSFLKENDVRLLKLAAGQMDSTDYTYVTNPFALKDSKYQQYPAKLRNFDFISSLYLRWISEFNQRTFDPIVYTKNSNYDNLQQKYEKSLIEQSINQLFVNNAIETGLFDPSQVDEQGNQVEPPMSPEVIKNMVSNLPDLHTIMGQHAMDYIVDQQQLKMKFRKAFDYFIKINKCVTFKEVRFDEVVLKVVSPLDVSYYGNKNVTFLEDAEAITVDYWLNFEEVLEVFQEMFEDYTEEYGDLAEILEKEMANGMPGQNSHFNTYMKNKYGAIPENRDVQEDRKCHVKHVCWTSFRKVKHVLDEEGKILNLTEDYDGDDVIKESWFAEERDGYVINNKYFLGGEATSIQRVDPDNPFSSKKQYNGRIFMQGDIEQLTPTEKLFQYQEAYNVVQFKLQSAINKDKGKFLTMPIGLLNGLKDTAPTGNIHYDGDANEEGRPIYKVDVEVGSQDSTIAKALYYADSTGVLFIDETAEGFAAAIQAIKAVDLSLGNWIEWLAARAEKLRSDAENLLGFNSARTGAIKASETVSNANNNLYSGSLITEEYFTEFEEFMASDFQGMLDLSKFAYRTGKKATYVRSNTDIAILKIDEGFQESLYGLFVKSSAKTKEVSDILKQQATNLIQNSPKGVSTVAKIIAGTNNYTAIIQEIEAKEDEMFNASQQNQEADRQNQLQLAQIQAEEKDKDRELKYYEIDTRSKTELAKTGIMGAGFNIGKDGGEDIATAMLAETNKMINEAQKNQLKAQEIRSRREIASENNATKLKVSADALKVAKTNKN